ncbi:MAG: cupredoxin domain-containing protein [Nitrososphaerales archaeon]
MKFNSFPALLSIAGVMFVVIFFGGLYAQSAISEALPLKVIHLVPKDDTAPTLQPWSYNSTNPSLEIKVGTKVRVILDNSNGFAVHDFVIEEGMGVHLAPDLFPTQKGSVDFFVGTPGEFTYFCSVPNHRQWGMEGTFIAVP